LQFTRPQRSVSEKMNTGAPPFRGQELDGILRLQDATSPVPLPTHFYCAYCARSQVARSRKAYGLLRSGLNSPGRISPGIGSGETNLAGLLVYEPTPGWQSDVSSFGPLYPLSDGRLFSERAPSPQHSPPRRLDCLSLLTYSWGRPFHAGPALSSIYGKIGIVGLGVNRAGWAAGRKCNDPERNGSHREHEPARGFPNQSSNGLS